MRILLLSLLLLSFLPATYKSSICTEIINNDVSCDCDRTKDDLHLTINNVNLQNNMFCNKIESLDIEYNADCFLFVKNDNHNFLIKEDKIGTIKIYKTNNTIESVLEIAFLSKQNSKLVKKEIYFYEQNGIVFFSFISQNENYKRYNKLLYDNKEILKEEYYNNIYNINNDLHEAKSIISLNCFSHKYDDISLFKHNQTINGQKGTVYTYNGNINIQDYANNYHGLAKITVCLYGQNSQTNNWELLNYQITGSYGDFSLHTPKTGYSNMVILIMTRDDNNDYFLDSTGNYYTYTLQSFPFYAGDFYGYQWYLPYASSVNQQFWTMSCIGHSYEYARYLSNYSTIPSINVEYSTELSSRAAYNKLEQKIKISSLNLGSIDGLKTTENWDILSHEYGHHIMLEFSFGDVGVGGHHALENSSCDYLHSQNVNNARSIGLRLAWNESYPSFFGNSMQNHYSAYLADISTCCNNSYDFTDGISRNYISPYYYAHTDSCELAIISFLYNLNDLDDDANDQMHLSDTFIFSKCCLMNDGLHNNSFNKFYKTLLSDNSIDKEKLATLLSYYGLVAKPNEIYLSQSNNSTYLNTTYVDNHIYFDYDHISYLFYDASLNYQFSIESYTNSYLMSNTEIGAIQNFAGNIFYVKAKFIYASADINDYYASNLISFNKTIL